MLKRATPAQRETFALALAQGMTAPEAAAQVGLKATWGYMTAREPAIVARVDELQAAVAEEVMRIFRAKAVRAARRITECIEPGYNLGNSAAVNLDAAKTTLGFIGLYASPKAPNAQASVTVKVYTDPRMDNPIEADWDDAPPPRSSADA